MRVLLIAAILAALSVPARSECLSSASAVWAVHPGSHPNWRLQLPGHVGEKCWYAKNSTNLPAPQGQERRVKDSPRCGVARNLREAHGRAQARQCLSCSMNDA